MKHLRWLLALWLIVLVCPLWAQESESVRQLQKFVRTYRYLDRFYVDTVAMEPIVEGAIRGMLEQLDPHSTYLSVAEMKQAKASLDGSFSGIGIEFSVMRDTICVARTIAGGPAERVGVMANDRIVRIDSLSAVGMKQNDVPNHLRGKRGTRVEIEVVRRGEPQPLHFTIKRDDIPLHTVDAAYMATPSVGYIKVGRFGRTTMDEFIAAYSRLGEPQRLILDLRGNSGGLMDQAIEMAGFFLPKGSLILSTEGRAVERTTYEASADGANLHGRVAVLIDEVSASASEIVSGALQDWDRATIIGQPSFGKGLVQRQIPLGDGSAIRLTIARYHTPSGRVIQRPYEEGKRAEYYRDAYRQRADSVADGAPLFRTLKEGRIVYGGGGIRPDCVVEEDTTYYTPGYARMVRRGLVQQSVADYLTANQPQLTASYPDFEEFDAAYEVPQELLEELKQQAQTKDVACSEEDYQRSEPLLRVQLKALVAQRLYGPEGFYRVMNPAQVAAYAEAVRLLEQE
ncbi:MAG: PDZ domain-containing protein [Alistipes sp.]|nr:PDZ domain-containing protein [Alistipes sp.]